MTIANYREIEVDTLDSLTRQSVHKDWYQTVVAAYEEPQEVVLSDQGVNGWVSLVRNKLYANLSVEDIYISIEDSNVDVWVVIPERDIATLDQLANIEWKMLKMFVSGEHPAFLIDFHVIYRCGRNVEELAPTKAIRLPR